MYSPYMTPYETRSMRALAALRMVCPVWKGTRRARDSTVSQTYRTVRRGSPTESSQDFRRGPGCYCREAAASPPSSGSDNWAPSFRRVLISYSSLTTPHRVRAPRPSPSCDDSRGPPLVCRSSVCGGSDACVALMPSGRAVGPARGCQSLW